MKRREFIAGLGAAAWPVAARAQQSGMPVIGFLSSGVTVRPPPSPGFIPGLSEMGYVEGRNVAVEFRGAEQYDQLPALAADLVRRKVAVIYASGSVNSAMAAKAATTTIPIVFANGSDPVRVGLVPSLSRPGGNVTGVTFFNSEVVALRLQHLRELSPGAAAGTIGFLTNPTGLLSELRTSDMLAAAQKAGQQMRVLTATTVNEIDTAFAAVAEEHLAALIVDGDGLLNLHHDQIVALAARYRILSTYPTRAFVDVGGLMSYGTNFSDSFRQIGVYTGQILKGASPADLPVVQSTKFEFVINMQTARALGIEVPEALLATADEVIQ
jgi:putative ABC transport system substrate-binding protein